MKEVQSIFSIESLRVTFCNALSTPSEEVSITVEHISQDSQWLR